MQRVCPKLWRHLSFQFLPNVFRDYLVNGAILGNTLLNIKCVMIFFTTFVLCVCHSQKNSTTYCHKAPVILARFSWNLYFLNRLSNKAQISSYIQIRLWEPSFPMQTDRRTCRSLVSFRNIANAPKICMSVIPRLRIHVLSSFWARKNKYFQRTG